MSRSKNALAIVAVAVLFAAPRAARAQSVWPARERDPFAAPRAPSCSPIAGGSIALSAIDTDARVGFIRTTLRTQAMRARLWSYGWGAAGAILVGGNVTLAATTSRSEQRVDDIVGAVTSVFIPAKLLLEPLRVMDDDATLDALARTLSAPDGHTLTCVLLARAEELLVLDAEDEALGTGWVAQAVGVGGSLAIGGVLGFGLGHWRGAALQAGGGIAISELQIWTQPTGAIDALKSYRHGRAGDRAESPSVVVSLAPLALAPLPWRPDPIYGGAIRVGY